CFADVFFGPYLWTNYRSNPPVLWVIVLAAIAATSAAAVALIWPRCQTSLLGILAVTAFVYLIFRPLAMPWSFWLMTLPLGSSEQYWLVRGPGGAVCGLLPSAIAVVVGGRYLFGMSVRDQW